MGRNFGRLRTWKEQDWKISAKEVEERYVGRSLGIGTKCDQICVLSLRSFTADEAPNNQMDKIYLRDVSLSSRWPCVCSMCLWRVLMAAGRMAGMDPTTKMSPCRVCFDLTLTIAKTALPQKKKPI